jgi:hypothetical protein
MATIEQDTAAVNESLRQLVRRVQAVIGAVDRDTRARRLAEAGERTGGRHGLPRNYADAQQVVGGGPLDHLYDLGGLTPNHAQCLRDCLRVAELGTAPLGQSTHPAAGERRFMTPAARLAHILISARSLAEKCEAELATMGVKPNAAIEQADSQIRPK